MMSVAFESHKKPKADNTRLLIYKNAF